MVVKAGSPVSVLTRESWVHRTLQNASLYRLSCVRKCRVSKYSVVTHELAEINLCLRNLDGAPHSTNQSHHQANKTVHPINTRSVPGSAEARNSDWHPSGGGGINFICLLTILLVCSMKVQKMVPRDAL